MYHSCKPAQHVGTSSLITFVLVNNDFHTGLIINLAGKLNPPSRLDVVRDPLYFQYDLTIHPSSQVGDTSVNGYTTEILIVKAEADIQKCVCNSAHEDGNIVRFFASNYTQSVLYFRTAATNDAGITSDFASYPDRIYVSVGKRELCLSLYNFSISFV